MPQVYSPGFEGMTTAMDYNFWAKFNNAKEEPDTAPELRDIVKKTYDFMWDQAYNGNRAPILIANHFNKWNGDSFNPVAMDFMKDKCGQPDTYCATYQDVIAWMELQDPSVLARCRRRRRWPPRPRSRSQPSRTAPDVMCRGPSRVRGATQAASDAAAASARSALALIASRSQTARPGATSLYVLAKRSSATYISASPRCIG